MGLKRRVTLLLPPFGSLIPPPGRHSGGGQFDSNSTTLRPKTVLETTSYSTSLFHQFWIQSSWFLIPKSTKKQQQIDISFKLGFEVEFWFQTPGFKCGREEQNPSKHMDCCSKIDFAQDKTYGQVASSLGSNLVPKLIKNYSNFDPRNTSEADFIFWCRMYVKSLPKRPPKQPQNAWSELKTNGMKGWSRFQMCFRARNLMIVWLISVPNSNQAKMRLVHKL